MKLKILIFSLIISISAVIAQKRHARQEVFHEVSNKEVVQSVFPKATQVTKTNDYWYNILDEKGKVLGFAMNSSPFCMNVFGYCKQTPVMIITNKKSEIQKVALLSNYETLSYVNKLVNNGFFNLWNGKSIKDAKNVAIDGYTGATMTARAVEKNVKFLLENGSKIKPTKKI